MLIILWIRSGMWQDTLYYVPAHGSRIYRVDTYSGRAYIGIGAWIPGFAEPALCVSGELLAPSARVVDSGLLGFELSKSAAYSGVFLPYWLITLLIGATAVVLGAAPRWRFSLKHWLIAATLLALVLGVSIFATRSTDEFYWRLF